VLSGMALCAACGLSMETDMEVVVYGRGLGLVVPGRSSVIDEVKQPISRPHVSFKVCESCCRTSGWCLTASARSCGEATGGMGYIKVVN
jgi:hypothetical protein